MQRTRSFCRHQTQTHCPNISRNHSKKKQIEIKQRKIFIFSLRHKIINFWLHGANFNDWNFGQHDVAEIIKLLQAVYPAKYSEKTSVKSLVYRTISRFRDADEFPVADPFRNFRVENKPAFKRKNPIIVELMNELLSEEKATTPKVRRGLRLNGFRGTTRKD